MKLFPLLFAGAFLAAAIASQAAVTVTLPTVSTAGSVVIDAPITFNVTAAGNLKYIAFDEWVTSDGGVAGLPFTPGTQFSYKINGGATGLVLISDLRDNLATTAFPLTPNDGLLNVNAFLHLSLGDVFTVLPGSYVLDPHNPITFNPQAAQTFTGNMFLVDASNARALSALTPAGAAVPEPSVALLFLAAAGLLITRRRLAPQSNWGQAEH